MLFVLFISLLMCGNFDFSYGQCNKCGTANIACLDKNTYQFCLEDEPVPSMGTHPCAADTVCVSSNPARCAGGEDVVASCGADCEVCVEATGVSCIDHKNFTLCENNSPTANVGQCPEKYVCNSASMPFCVLESATEGSSCPIPPETEEPPPDQSTDPTEFCLDQQNVRFPKKFPVPGNCKRFNYCAIIDTKTEGYQYPCPSDLEFDCKKQSCGQICVPC